MTEIEMKAELFDILKEMDSLESPIEPVLAKLRELNKRKIALLDDLEKANAPKP